MKKLLEASLDWIPTIFRELFVLGHLLSMQTLDKAMDPIPFLSQFYIRENFMVAGGKPYYWAT